MKKKRVTKINARRIQDSDIAIGERIRARRNQIDMSLESLGGAQQVQKYEKGVNRISSGRLILLANALQCSATDLIGDGGKAPLASTPFSRLRPQRRVWRSSMRWPKYRAWQSAAADLPDRARLIAPADSIAARQTRLVPRLSNMLLRGWQDNEFLVKLTELLGSDLRQTSVARYGRMLKCSALFYS